MKKTSIIIAILSVLFIGGVASAQIVGYKTTPNDTFEQITNSLIDQNRVTVYKFKDGNTTCYGSFSVSRNGNVQTTTATSISCK